MRAIFDSIGRAFSAGPQVPEPRKVNRVFGLFYLFLVLCLISLLGVLLLLLLPFICVLVVAVMERRGYLGQKKYGPAGKRYTVW